MATEGSCFEAWRLDGDRVSGSLQGGSSSSTVNTHLEEKRNGEKGGVSFAWRGGGGGESKR